MDVGDPVRQRLDVGAAVERPGPLGGGDGSLIDMVREYVTPKTIMETSGGDSSTGEFLAPPAGAQGAVFAPIPPPRMPPKDEQ